jgi:hypothetical protein
MLMLALLAAAAAPGDGKTMASDDWHKLAIYGVAADTDGPVYLQVHAGDLDGDGAPDDVVLKLDCAGGELRAAQYTIMSPRDASSGQASGKRMHKPMKIVKEWGPATPLLREGGPTYNIKEMKGARAAADGWTPIALSNTSGLCPAAEAAAAAIVKSKSNITNN